MSEELWEKMPDETAAQYEKFCAYRDMRYTMPLDSSGIPKLNQMSRRSIRVLAEQLHVKRQALEPFSIRFHWKERCEAYDLYILHRQQEKNKADAIKMRETHTAIAMQMLKKALRRIQSLEDSEISAADVVRLIDTGVKIERLSRGESTGHQVIEGETALRHNGAVDVTVENSLNLSALSDEEVETLERLLHKLRAESGI